MKLGINGLGRIGKLSLWHHVSRKHYSGIVANIGRDVGRGLEDLASMLPTLAEMAANAVLRFFANSGRKCFAIRAGPMALISCWRISAFPPCRSTIRPAGFPTSTTVRWICG